MQAHYLQALTSLGSWPVVFTGVLSLKSSELCHGLGCWWCKINTVSGCGSIKFMSLLMLIDNHYSWKTACCQRICYIHVVWLVTWLIHFHPLHCHSTAWSLSYVIQSPIRFNCVYLKYQIRFSGDWWVMVVVARNSCSDKVARKPTTVLQR